MATRMLLMPFRIPERGKPHKRLKAAKRFSGLITHAGASGESVPTQHETRPPTISTPTSTKIRATLESDPALDGRKPKIEGARGTLGRSSLRLTKSPGCEPAT